MSSKARLTHSLFITLFMTGLFLGLRTTRSAAQGNIPSPEEYFGFQMGTDRKIARWDRIVDYFQLLEKESDRIRVVNMGPSTMRHPFLMVYISSAENLAKMNRLQEVNQMISDPRGLSEAEVEALIREGKAVICQSMSLHATEIGGTQMTPELAFDLLTSPDEATRRILDNVMYIMIPCFNPDGQIMVTDWYRETVGTGYEGMSLPWLYHKYAGHDNNRDGDFLNLVESKYAAKVMYVDWPPQAYIDHHHMGSYGARFYVPPYCEPIRPYADPLIWREISWYGAHIAYKLEENGKQGILNAAQYPGWGHFGWHWITLFHNITGMLTESANTSLASPLYIHPDQLQAGGRAFPDYEAQSTFPNPWPGGWWRLRDIVENKKIAAWAMLDLAARNRETVLRNAYLKAKRQSERGAAGSPNAVIVPATQHDPLTMTKMINTLLQSGIDIHKATADFMVEDRHYPKDSYLISFAQPKIGLIRNLLVETHYADNAWTRDRGGSPMRPYDLSTHTMHEFMGVRVDPVDAKPDGKFVPLKSVEPMEGSVHSGNNGYVLDGRLNDSYKAVNLLLDSKITVHRVTHSTGDLRVGDFIIKRASQKVLARIARKTGVSFNALKVYPNQGTKKVKRARTGMYQGYYGGNMDEGWTRMLLEQFAFPYTSLMDAEILKGEMEKAYDVIVLPSNDPCMITGKMPEEYIQKVPADYPKKYLSGIGKEGIENLKTFVNNGGTLVAMADATEFAVETFELQVENVIEDVSSRTEFFCPGSTLKAHFANDDPLAYGMPEEGLVLFRSSPTFRIKQGRNGDQYKTIVRYVDKDVLQSGWLIGEKRIAKKAGMVEAKVGKGRVILIGFRTQHRCQTHGTFKLLFNTMIR
ncbi:MAG: M14 family metallopeptidase [Planctomycetota bacterium]|jgi:hypothetical protein